MEVKKLTKELKKLYPNKSFDYLETDLKHMHKNGFKIHENKNLFMLYKIDSRLHCDFVIIVDTLISTKKGEGAKAISFLLNTYPNHKIQLDCAVNNTAIEFYKKQGFEIRANSLIYKEK